MTKNVFSAGLRDALVANSLQLDVESIEEHSELLRQGSSPIRRLTETERTIEMNRVQLKIAYLKQAALGRAGSLFAPTVSALESNNTIAFSLLCRGHQETTAQLGYVCGRLGSYKSGTINLNELHTGLFRALMGHTDERISFEYRPINILTLLEKAMKFVTADGLSLKGYSLTDSYNCLSNFSHPNFSSNEGVNSFADSATGPDFYASSRQDFLEKRLVLVNGFGMSCYYFNYFWGRLLELEKSLS